MNVKTILTALVLGFALTPRAAAGPFDGTVPAIPSSGAVTSAMIEEGTITAGDVSRTSTFTVAGLVVNGAVSSHHGIKLGAGDGTETNVSMIPGGTVRVNFGSDAIIRNSGSMGLQLTGDAATGFIKFEGGAQHYNRTKAQIDTFAPAAIGMTIFCTNCNTNGDLCVSTGTAVAQFKRVGAGATVGCGTGE